MEIFMEKKGEMILNMIDDMWHMLFNFIDQNCS